MGLHETPEQRAERIARRKAKQAFYRAIPNRRHEAWRIGFQPLANAVLLRGETCSDVRLWDDALLGQREKPGA